MSAPTDSEVKSGIHEQLALMIRQMYVIRAGVERAEAGFDPGDFVIITDALDTAASELLTALGSAD